MVQKLNQVYFNEVLKSLVVVGVQLGFCYRGGGEMRVESKGRTVLLEKCLGWAAC